MARPTKPKTKKIEFTPVEKIDINKIKLDFNNIRLAHTKITSDNEIRTVMWKQFKLKDLYDDIHSRGLQEPLVLYPDSFVVAEGNCRLVCLMKIYEDIKQLDDSDDSYEISCIRIKKNTVERDIEAWLAVVHVGQKKEWPEFNQAQLMHKLYHIRGLSFEEIARIVRLNRKTVNDKIDTYHQVLKYKSLLGRSWHSKFIYVYEFVKNKELSEFKEKDQNVRRFMEWVNGGKFQESKQVRNLGKILSDSKTKKEFEVNNYNSAFELLIQQDPTVKDSFFKKASNMNNYLSLFPQKDLLQIIQEPARKRILLDLSKSLSNLLDTINSLENHIK